jgi:hypothetical protein
MTDPIQTAKDVVAKVEAVATFAAPVEAKAVAVDNKIVAYIKANPAKAALATIAFAVFIVWKIL